MHPQNWSNRLLAAFSRRSNQRPVSVSKLLELRMYLESLEDRTVPATFTVTNTADVGAGSLRQAILDANATGGTDTINFSITGGGVHTITPLPALPVVTDPVDINGYTQSGASVNTLAVGDDAVLRIELSGASVNGAVSGGLHFAAGSAGSTCAASS